MQVPQTAPTLSWLTIASGWVALGFLTFLAIAILYYVYTQRIDLSGLISEPTGDASMSRFQLLIFTFVIAASLFLIIASGTPPSFPKEIPQGVLILLGISSSAYLVSKGIQFSTPQGVSNLGPEVKITATSDTTTAGGKTIQFKAEVVGLSSNVVSWSVDPATGMGDIDANGLYSPPPDPSPAPKPTGNVTIRASSAQDKTIVDMATITLV
jgi:hypothetical protein